MDLRIMGNVEIHDGTAAIALRRTGERCVLASLALNPGHRIQVGTLIERIWGGEPPANAEYTVASYTRAVRRTIAQGGGQREWLTSHRPGAYQLDVAPDLIDYHRFTALLARARREQRTGNPGDAVLAYQHAVQLRRGEPLANVSTTWAQDRRYTIDQEYLAAVYELFEQQIAIGQFAAVATSATRLVAELTPTDRMIVLAAYGLAGSGQHAAIPDFLDYAARRMWETAEVSPSAEAVAIARDLVARPEAQLGLPRPVNSERSTGPAFPADDLDPKGSDQAPTVTMTAHHNGHVYQSAENQYIVDAAR